MRRNVLRITTTTAAMIVGLGVVAARQADSPPAQGAVRVPEGNGAPVITDGIFTPGEWDDALQIPLNATARLCVKHYRGVVFIGVRGGRNAEIGPSDLFVAIPGGQIRQFHVSAQLFEGAFPAEEGFQPRFGLTTDWYANEVRRDMAAEARLKKEGKTPMEIIRGSAYPSDGIEFAIRRSKFPGERWLMRVQASAFLENKPGMLTYPAAAAEKTTAGWLELRFSK